jgi:hypothetical protein
MDIIEVNLFAVDERKNKFTGGSLEDERKKEPVEVGDGSLVVA